MTESELINHAIFYAEWIERKCSAYKRIVIYGTSEEATAILSHLQGKSVFSKIFYILSTTSFSEEKLFGIPVRENMALQDDRDCVVILDYRNSLYAKNILFQNEKARLFNVYEKESFYSGDVLMDYSWTTEPKTEEELINSCKENINKEMIGHYVQHEVLFGGKIRAIELETVNRCNGKCSFCPVNVNADSRELRYMDVELFKKIINQLSVMNYDGRLSLFSNNEPFLDKRIVEFHKYAREKLPLCKLHLFTNGTLLTLKKLQEILLLIDELIIDNYSDSMELPQNLQEFVVKYKNDTATKQKLTIVMRRQTELLSTRGGDAKNRTAVPNVGSETCALPFQQMIIRPDGKVSLCCNDPLGKYTLGDLTKQSILQVWNSEEYIRIRKALKCGRQNIDQCKKCDAFYYYY